MPQIPQDQAIPQPNAVQAMDWPTLMQFMMQLLQMFLTRRGAVEELVAHHPDCDHLVSAIAANVQSIQLIVDHIESSRPEPEPDPDVDPDPPPPPPPPHPPLTRPAPQKPASRLPPRR